MWRRVERSYPTYVSSAVSEILTRINGNEYVKSVRKRIIACGKGNENPGSIEKEKLLGNGRFGTFTSRKKVIEIAADEVTIEWKEDCNGR